MSKSGQRFETNKDNGKLLGVCAGIADQTGLDVTIVRIALVVVTLMGAFPWTLIAYAAAAWLGKPRARSGHSLPRSSSGEDSRARMRSLDLRMQAIETHVTSSNSRLAREIEELR